MKLILQSMALALSLGCGALPSAAQNTSAAVDHPLPRQAPGYYKWSLGEFAITSLSDGTLNLPVDELLHGPKPGEVAAAFQTAFASLPMEMSVNAFLIDTGRDLLLVDAGGGALYGPSLGQLRENLIAAGYRPEEVDSVLLTHLHGDHSGGLLLGGQQAFPNATVHVSQADLDYFLAPANQEGATDLDEINFSAAQAAFSAYQSSGQLMPLPEDGVIAPGVRALPAPGHSPGHFVYEVKSRDQSLMLLGDLVHVPQVQFEHPEYSMAFDFDEEMGETARRKFLQEASAEAQWIAGAHLPFPGIGHIRAEDGGYVYVPAEYTANR